MGSEMCIRDSVLSHTNAARYEIENCLGRTAAGVAMLSYPHFIGTIHGFINEFLAIPWLRSVGYPITAIDDNLCEQHRRRLLTLNQFSSLRSYIERQERRPEANFIRGLNVSSSEFLVTKENGNPVFVDQDAPSACQLRTLARKCVEDGSVSYTHLTLPTKA